MNQAVLYVTPSVRWSWCALKPFLLDAMRTTAWCHLRSGTFDASNTVPTLTVNWLLQP